MRGISPVVATVILVAVAIAVSMAFAMWASTLTSVESSRDLEIISSYNVPVEGGWSVTVDVKNIGTRTTSIIKVMVNRRVCDIIVHFEGSSGRATYPAGGANYHLGPGDRVTLRFILKSQESCGIHFTPGQMVEITIITSSGMEYPQSIQLR
ncbi:MAG: archaellin/type IV pilin N-terminal domain-containing protein [Thermosphaera sp.]